MLVDDDSDLSRKIEQSSDCRYCFKRNGSMERLQSPRVTLTVKVDPDSRQLLSSARLTLKR